jgi:FkbM family methyltransferase
MHIVRGTEEFTVAEGHGWFWPKFADQSWEPSTFRIFDKFLKPDGVMLDIGAWIGPTALYAARRTGKILAFEPDPVAHASLCQNLELNNIENVVPYPVAVSSEWEGIPFGPKTGYGDSMSSQIWAKGDDQHVPAVSLASLVASINPDFIKIDIEGGEKFLFEGDGSVALKVFKPTIHLSLHTPDMMDDFEGFKKAVVDGIGFYPFFYDEDLNRIELEQAFNPRAFNAVIATFTEIV